MGFEKGNKLGKGRPSKAEEEKSNRVFLNMLKSIHSVTTDDEAKQELAKTLYGFERGQMFIAEHIFGKPKEIKEVEDVKDIFEIKISRADGT